ncbi:hypothetical protein HDU85_004118 [Gaertneriomyces sp. JEL0708]|nr:hypothetical protein HDU85_004118 [Gaertneriomyces sp. JEL0708]
MDVLSEQLILDRQLADLNHLEKSDKGKKPETEVDDAVLARQIYHAEVNQTAASLRFAASLQNAVLTDYQTLKQLSDQNVQEERDRQMA